jgi:hypothetical protein
VYHFIDFEVNGKKMEEGGSVEENTYNAYYKGKSMEVTADTTYHAQIKAAEAFKAKKRYDVSVVLVKLGNQEIVHSTAEFKKGGKVGELYELELEAEPNPDYDNHSHEGTVKIKKHKVVADSLFDAKMKYFNFINENDLGSGNVPPSALYKDGKKIGEFSYNGRLWDNDGKEVVVNFPEGKKFETGGAVEDENENGYMVVGKKAGQLVEVSESPMSKSDALEWIKDQAIENYYTNVNVIPYHGKKPIVKVVKGVIRFEDGGGFDWTINKGDLVMNKNVGIGKVGLIGLVVADIDQDDEYEVLFRGLNGEVHFCKKEDLIPAENYIERLESNGDLEMYEKIAQKNNIPLNPKYRMLIDERELTGEGEHDEYAKGGTVSKGKYKYGIFKNKGGKDELISVFRSNLQSLEDADNGEVTLADGQFIKKLTEKDGSDNHPLSKKEKYTHTKDGVKVEKGTDKYKGHIFYEEDGSAYRCLGYFPKIDDCVYENVESGNKIVGCMDGFYFNNPNKKAKGGAVKTESDELWIKDAIKHKGSLRRKAKDLKLIKGEEKLTLAHINRIEKLGKAWKRKAELAKRLMSFEYDKKK